MIVECPRCKKMIDIGDTPREESSCGVCETPLRDISAMLEHNRQEIQKILWHKKPFASSNPGDSTPSEPK